MIGPLADARRSVASGSDFYHRGYMALVPNIKVKSLNDLLNKSDRKARAGSLTLVRAGVSLETLCPRNLR